MLGRGYTPQQALAYAQDYDGIAGPISPIEVGAPSVRELTADDFAPVDLSGIGNVSDLSIDIAATPSVAMANPGRVGINAATGGTAPLFSFGAEETAPNILTKLLQGQPLFPGLEVDPLRGTAFAVT